LSAQRVLLATLFCSFAAAAIPATSLAGPAHDRGLTIAATPDLILAGESVLIYGQLNGPDNAGQSIRLYHRINPHTSFSLVATTTSNTAGFYVLPRGEGVVVSNRSWFVRGPDTTHSRTIHEGVTALVSLASSTTTAATGQPIVFSGGVTPSHRSQPLELQEQGSLGGNGWRTIAKTATATSSSFSVPHRWDLPGIYTVRAVLPGDQRNLEGDSDSTTVVITQKQVPSFTIASSAQIVLEGETVTISGMLYQPDSTASAEPSTEVTLYGKMPGGTFKALATAVTASDGSFSFTQTPVHNAVYKVETLGRRRGTAELYEGVQDVVTTTASSASGMVGGTVSLSGTVSPDHSGHPLELQRLGTDGYWHAVAAGVVTSASTYSLTYTFGEEGAMQLRTRIYGGPENVGAVSPTVTIAVSGVVPVTSLPPAS
jgi:hypothetical protein